MSKRWRHGYCPICHSPLVALGGRLGCSRETCEYNRREALAVVTAEGARHWWLRAAKHWPSRIPKPREAC